MTDLSILIPARNEMFLINTIQDIIKHAESDYEIIVVLDGDWSGIRSRDVVTELHPRVTFIHHSESIGQRAATNEAARIAKGKYVMKVDAHCAFDQGFDVKLLQDMQPDWTMVPVMRNLHAFDWVCPACKHRIYQGPTPQACPQCGGQMEREIVWVGKRNPQSTAYRFDKSLHFQYWPEYKARQQGDLVETMSIQGSCFLVTREKYFELELCDEGHGSWGQQGVEVACKTWLSGGRVIVSKKTWYAHMFRTQGGDFGFPYPNPGIQKAREYSRNLWLNNQWPKAVHPLSWLIERFAPVPDWDVSKGVVYYTDNRLDPEIMQACQAQLRRAVNGHRVVSVSLQPMDYGDNIVLALERGYLTMFKQILAGLEALDCDVVFLCEHDVLYHPSHFKFVPARSDIYYYNTNVWKVRASDGHALYYDCKQTSGLCADRELLVQHYRERVRRVEAEGYNRRMGFEPGTHSRAERIDDHKSETWRSEYPNIDIRHGLNLTPSRWKPEQFRDQRNCRGWIEADEVPGWGMTSGRFAELLRELI